MKIPKNYLIYALLIFIIFIHLLLLSKLIFFPYPELFIYPYLTKHGLLPYREIFDQHFPGLMFLPINLATMGMNSPFVARYWHYGTVAIIHIVLFFVSKKIFKSNIWTLAVNLLYLVWQPFFEGYVLWIDLFVTPLLLGSFYFLIPERKQINFFYSGLFIGLSLLLKQVVLPIIGFLLIYFLIKSERKNVYYYISGILIPVTILVYFIISKSIANDFVYWTLTFNLTTFARMGRKLPQVGDVLKLIPVFGLAGAVLLYSLAKKIGDFLILLAIYFVGSLAFAYARFDYVHFQPALPFALLGLVFAFNKLLPKKGFVLMALYLITSILMTSIYYKSIDGNKILFFGEYERKITDKVQVLSEPGDKVFAFGAFPHLNQQTDTLPPGNLYVFQFPWFMKEAEDRILNGMINDPPKVIVRDTHITIAGVNIVDFMPKINRYIDNNYNSVDSVDSAEILVNK